MVYLINKTKIKKKNTDLTFLNDGNPDFIGNLVNFGKRTKIANVISEVCFLCFPFLSFFLSFPFPKII